MIVRIMGQGQWVLEPEHLMELNELDRALEDRVAAGDEPGMLEALKGLVEGVRARGIEVHAFDAGAIARELGNAKLVNTVMLGAIADYLPFPAEILKEAILVRFRERKPGLAAVNEEAFEAGRAAQAAT